MRPNFDLAFDFPDAAPRAAAPPARPADAPADPWQGWPTAPAPATAPGVEAEIVGLNGAVQRVRLLVVDAAHAQVSLRLSAYGAPVQIQFTQMRALSLAAPVPVGEVLARLPREAAAAGASSLRIAFDGGAPERLQALGLQDLPDGLMLWRLAPDGATARHQFVVRAALREVRVEHGHDPEVAALLTQQVATSREALAAAREAAGRLASARLGTLLLALGLVPRARLDAMLAAQQRTPQVSLGEALLRAGDLTPAQLQEALRHKMGCPMVDLRRFAVDPRALQVIPFAIARRAGVLPAAFLDRALVVVTDDPHRPEVFQDLSFRAQRPVIAALPASGDLARAIGLEYERHDLAGPSWHE